MNCLLFSFLKTLFFGITQWFSYQYITYYIPLESFDFPLSNGIVVKVKFSHISYLLNCLFKYLIYLQCNQCYSKYQNIAGNVRYPTARHMPYYSGQTIRNRVLPLLAHTYISFSSQSSTQYRVGLVVSSFTSFGAQESACAVLQ